MVMLKKSAMRRYLFTAILRDDRYRDPSGRAARVYTQQKRSKLYSALLLFSIFCLFTPLLAKNFSVALELADVSYIKAPADAPKNVRNKIMPTVFTGNSFRLNVVVSGEKKAPNTVSVAGLENFTQTGKAYSSSMSANNNDVSMKMVTTYILVPQKTGVFSIGPATLNQDGNIIESNVVNIRVAEREERHTAQWNDSTCGTKTSGQTSNTDATTAPYELFCELKSDKKEAFVEEPVTLTLSIYRRGEVANIQNILMPQFSNCTIKNDQKINEYRKEINGKTYSVVEKTLRLFPKEDGELNISPTKIIYNVREKQGRRPQSFLSDAFFSGFFNFDIKQKVTASNAIKINVKKLPPTNMTTNGIGTFSSITASVDKKNVTVNEPIKYSITINGRANFDLILKPNLELPRFFKSYDSKKSSTDTSKTFEFILQIPNPGTWTIPPQTFHYFDTASKTYQTLQTEPINIETTMPATGEAHAQPPTQYEDDADDYAEESKPLNETKDIHFIHEDVPVRQEAESRMSILLFLLWLMMIPILIFFKKISAFVYPFYAYFFTSKNRISKHRVMLEKAIESNSPEKFYTLFIQFLSESFNVPISEVNQDWIQQRFSNKISQEKIDGFIKFLNECAQYSFASEQKMDETSLKEIVKKARYWMLTIHTEGS